MNFLCFTALYLRLTSFFLACYRFRREDKTFNAVEKDTSSFEAIKCIDFGRKNIFAVFVPPSILDTNASTGTVPVSGPGLPGRTIDTGPVETGFQLKKNGRINFSVRDFTSRLVPS